MVPRNSTVVPFRGLSESTLILLGPQYRFGDIFLRIWQVCLQNGTAVLEEVLAISKPSPCKVNALWGTVDHSVPKCTQRLDEILVWKRSLHSRTTVTNQDEFCKGAFVVSKYNQLFHWILNWKRSLHSRTRATDLDEIVKERSVFTWKPERSFHFRPERYTSGRSLSIDRYII